MQKRIEGIRYSINQIAKFKNPIGKVLDQWKRPNNLKIKKNFNTNWCYWRHL